MQCVEDIDIAGCPLWCCALARRQPEDMFTLRLSNMRAVVKRAPAGRSELRGTASSICPRLSL